MKLVLHPLVHSDIAETMEFYEREGGSKLAADFYHEFRRCASVVLNRPLSFSVFTGDLRRIHLNRFPFHLLYQVAAEEVFVLIVRHHARHPDFGLDR